MRVHLVGMIAMLAVAQTAQAEIKWETDFKKATAAAKTAGKPVIVDFTATWCGPCRQMEQTTFKDPAVVKLMEKAVCAKIDIDKNKDLARKYSITSIPAIMVLSKDGKEVGKIVGLGPIDAFKKSLTGLLAGKAAKTTELRPGYLDPEEVITLRRKIKTRSYVDWRNSNPGQAARARRFLVAQLGSYDPELRNRAAATLVMLEEDAVPTMIEALKHRDLAVRVSAYDGVVRLMTTRYKALSSALPAYDPWSPQEKRMSQASSWERWWANRKSLGEPRFL